jgi:AraC-like DNA-binding protein
MEKYGAGNETFYVMIVPPFLFEEAIDYTEGRVPRKPLVMDIRRAHGFYIDSQASSALRLYTDQPPLWELEAKLRALNLIARVFEIYLENSHTEIPGLYRAEHSAEHRIDHLVEFLGRNPSAPAGVPEMAERCLMSEATFFRKFKRSTGFTPQQLLIRLRIGKACELLADTAIPISQAAYQSGFRSVQNFNYAFKTKMGMTPGEFRTQHQRETREVVSVL